MPCRSRIFLMAVALLGVALLEFTYAQSATAGVVISANEIGASVFNPTGASNSDHYFGTTIPAQHLLDATVGDFFSRIDIDYSGGTSGASLSNDISQKRNSNVEDRAQGYNYTKFTVSADMSYLATGFFKVSDVSGAGTVSFSSYLYDYTSSSYVFVYLQESQSTVNESFTLGDAGGDFLNDQLGSLSGTLLAGHEYLWHWSAYIEAFPDADDGASAVGNFTLVLDDGGAAPSAVPEPGSLLLWGFGALGLTCIRKRRRQSGKAR